MRSSLTSPLTRPLTSPITRAVTDRGVGPSLGAQARALFGASDPGAMYDLTDASSLYVDSAGATPITTAGQLIGRALDKSGKGNHATQPTTASKAIWQTSDAAFDGVDDFLSTAAINFTTTDKVTVVAGVTKLSDAAIGMLVELSSVMDTNAGSFYLSAPNAVGASGNFGAKSRGSAAMAAYADSGAVLAPVSRVVAGLFDISADTTRLRLNGAQVASHGADQGTGNFGNYPLFIGRRGGTTLPFNGRISRLLIIGRLLTPSELAVAERWVAQPLGIVLP